MSKRFGVILLSGGLDSTTVATQAKREGWELRALTMDYGQTHRRELAAARAVATRLRIEQRQLDVSFYGQLAWHSALTGEVRVPRDRDPEELGEDEIPVTYVPMRNTFFLSVAAAALENVALMAIEVEKVPPEEIEAAIFIAANAVDYSGYPDCRPEYYEVIGEALRRGSKLSTAYGVDFEVKTPLLSKSKAEIVRLATELRAPLDVTWSCYVGGETPCGACDSCVLRAAGFAEAGLPDPALG